MTIKMNGVALATKVPTIFVPMNVDQLSPAELKMASDLEDLFILGIAILSAAVAIAYVPVLAPVVLAFSTAF